MSIFFIILKIIGILLLILLLLAAVLLFHPVFYHVWGEMGDEVAVCGRFWWLFRILRFEFEVEAGEAAFHFFIFGREKTASEDAHEKSLEPEAASQDTAPVRDSPEMPQEKPPQRSEEESSPAKKVSKEETSGRDAAKRKRKSRKKNIKGSVGSNWKERAAQWKKELSDEANHQAVAHLFQEACYLLRHLKPRAVKAELSFCAGDPAVTGYVTGALSLVPAMYRSGVHIFPDFLSEDCYIRGSFAMRGRMALYHLLRMLLRIWKDNNCMRLYKKIRS